MATIQEAIRRLSVQVTEKGVSETTDKLRGLAKVEGEVTVAQRERATATGSLQKSLDRIQRQYDDAYRQQQKLQQIERELMQHRAAGLIDLNRQNELMTLAKNKIVGVTEAATIWESRAFFKTLAREAALVGGPLGGVISQFGTLSVGSSKLSLALVGGTIGFAAIAAATYKAVAAYAEFEAHEAKVAALLNLTGGAQSLGGLEALTRDLSKSGTQSVADIRATEVELLKLRAVAGSTFGEVLTLSRDVAATGFASMSGAASALGKALKDPSEASKELDGIGLKLSVSQQRLAKDLFNSGQAAAAQRVILKAVSDQVKGSDAIAADTLSASWGRATNALVLQFEQIGKTIAEMFHLKGALDAVALAAENAARAQREESQAFESRLKMAQQGQLTSGEKGDLQQPVLSRSMARRGTLSPPFNAEEWNDLRQGMQDAEKRVAKVTDALADQARVAGMTTTAHKIFAAQVEAGVLTQDQLKNGLLGTSDAARKLAAAVNEIAAKDFMKGALIQFAEQKAGLQGEIDTINMAIGPAAAYRRELELLARAQAEGVTLSPARRSTIKAEAAAYGEVAQAAEKAKIGAQNDFASKTALFSDQDVQIAQQLKGLYGNDIPKALASTEAAQMRTTAALHEIGKVGIAAFSGLTSEILSGANGMDLLIGRLGAAGKSLTAIGEKSLLGSLQTGLAGGGFNFDPASLAAGAVGIGISLVSNYLEGQKKADAELKKNQKAWFDASDAVADFTAKLGGGTGGGLTGQIKSINKDFIQFAKLAIDAKEMGAALLLAAQTIAAYTRLQNEFRASFEGMLQAMADGTGPDGPFSKGVQTIKDLTSQVKDFVADTTTVFTNALAGQKFGVIPVSGPTDAAAQIAAAQAAGRAMLLAQLSGVTVLSDVAGKLAELAGKSVGLEQALIDLGSSAADATAAISAARTQGIAKIAQDFVDGMTRELNEASDRGFVNQITDLIKKAEQQRADAALLPNVDTSLIDRLFAAQAQKIVDQAGLVGDSFTDLINLFPSLRDKIHESTDALKANADALKQQRDAANGTAKTVVDFLAGLQSGPNATVSPLANLTNSQAFYNANLGLALGGNLDAQNKFVSLADNLEKAARAVYASGTGYQDIRNQIINQGLSLPAVVATTDPVVEEMRDTITAIPAEDDLMKEAA